RLGPAGVDVGPSARDLFDQALLMAERIELTRRHHHRRGFAILRDDEGPSLGGHLFEDLRRPAAKAADRHEIGLDVEILGRHSLNIARIRYEVDQHTVSEPAREARSVSGRGSCYAPIAWTVT